ncbi:MAG: zinc ribbon domain-containing protein [Candidatus Binatia bacterium]
MPIYEYVCRHCHMSFEQLLLSRDETIACPNCESHAVERKLSLFSSPGGGAGEDGTSGGCGCTPTTCACR